MERDLIYFSLFIFSNLFTYQFPPLLSAKVKVKEEVICKTENVHKAFNLIGLMLQM